MIGGETVRLPLISTVSRAIKTGDTLLQEGTAKFDFYGTKQTIPHTTCPYRLTPVERARRGREVAWTTPRD